MDAGRTRFAMLVDCGHDNLVRDDHPPLEDERSSRIYAGDFLRRQGVERLDLLLSPISTGIISEALAGCWIRWR